MAIDGRAFEGAPGTSVLNGAPENIVSLEGQRQLVANIGLAAGLTEVLAALGIDALDIADVLQHTGTRA